jgi:hypothetical protein
LQDEDDDTVEHDVEDLVGYDSEEDPETDPEINAAAGDEATGQVKLGLKKLEAAFEAFAKSVAESVRDTRGWVCDPSRAVRNLEHVMELLPRVQLSETWTAADRERIEYRWKKMSKKMDRLLQVKTNNDLLTLYKACLRLMRCLPEDIIGCRFNMKYDLEQNRATKKGGDRSLL